MLNILEQNFVIVKAKRRKVMLRLSSKEKKLLIHEAGEIGFALLDYYLSCAGIPNFNYTDDKAATTLGWKKRKVTDTRLKLTKLNWFYQATGTLSNGKKSVVTYLLKETVGEAKASQLNLESIAKIPQSMQQRFEKEKQELIYNG